MLTAIQDFVRDETLTPAELTEMMFIDKEFEAITADEMKALSQYENLDFMSFASVGLKSIEAPFPALANCGAVLFSNNSLGNEVLSTLVNLVNLESLALDGNPITSLDKFALLSCMPKLREISLSDCPVADAADYRAKLFAILPQVQIIDDVDREGNAIELSSDEESEEVDFDSEDEDSEGPVDLGEFFGNEIADEEDDEEDEEDSEEDDEGDEDDEDDEDDEEEDEDEEDDQEPESKKARN